jgi:hypothetical protein
MKVPVIVFALAAATILAGCGDGSSNDPATTFGTSNASALPSPPSLAGNGSSSPPAPAMSIDPPSPPVAMSAGVTETIDPPNPASAPASTMALPTDTTSVTAQQLPPVVHYPPDPSGTDD